MDPDKIIRERMYANDAFSQWLGIEISHIGLGTVELYMTVRPEMTNGFGIAHGGITYALADSALAFASNAHGNQSVSIETAISHLRPVRTGDRLRAIAREDHLSNRTGVYRVEIYREDELVALFKGTVYRTGKEWT